MKAIFYAFANLPIHRDFARGYLQRLCHTGGVNGGPAPLLPSERDELSEFVQALPDPLFEEFAEAANARDWILCQLPHDRASTVLHGDLLPQNLLLDREDCQIAVVDWECAQIGDPAYDRAIVTRGVRKPLGVPGGLHRLVQFYNEAAEHKISANAVVVHEVLLHRTGWSRRPRPRQRIGSEDTDRSIMRIFWKRFYGELVRAPNSPDIGLSPAGLSCGQYSIGCAACHPIGPNHELPISQILWIELKTEHLPRGR